jgi:SAM-dependent methyltransferase
MAHELEMCCSVCGKNGVSCGTEGVLSYYHYCAKCETLWLSNRTLYDKKKKDIYDKEYVSKMNSADGIKGYRRLAEQYFHLLHYITNMNGWRKADPFKFIEIGFSLPSVITYFYKHRYDVTGLDIKIAPEIKTYLDPLIKTGRFRFIESDFEAWETDEKFDVIWMSHVLEHFENTKSILYKIKNLLHDNGVAFISSPDSEYIKELGFDILKGHMHPQEHLFMYSIDTFSELCKLCGLKVCYSERYGDPIPDHFEFVTKMEWRAVITHKERKL